MSEERKPAERTTGAPSAARVAEIMDRLLAGGDVARVYGEPVRHGDTLVIPAAEVLTIAGFGMGSGSGAAGGSGTGARRGSGGGGGGGGRTLARAVAVVVSSPTGVEVRPIVDVTKIALAALTAAGFVWASWRRLADAKRRFGR